MRRSPQRHGLLRLLSAPLSFVAGHPAAVFLAMLAVLLVGSQCAAQTIRIEAQSPYTGWARCTVDTKPPHAAGLLADGTVYVVGRPVGLDTHIVDLRGSWAGRHVLDLSKSKAIRWAHPALDVPRYGWPHIAGVPMDLAHFQADGAGYLVHLRKRTGAMIHADLWAVIYPGQSWCSGEVRVTASNPTVPDLAATVPANFRLSWGDAVVSVLGREDGAVLVSEGVVFSDGQATALPFVVTWPSQETDRDAPNIQAAKNGLVQAVGIANLLADGNPTLPAGFDALAWAEANRAGAISALHSWSPAVCGPAAFSGTTGGQDDQTFVRAEALRHERALLVTYLSALKLANRPCHHLEADGSPLNHLGHHSPRLVLWDGRAHWHRTVSPDQLGKPRALASWDIAGGWFGPDVEHAFANTLFAGCRLTGSSALQAEASMWARIYLRQWTIQPGLTTSAPFAARAIGWEGILAVHMWRDLEDRPLAGLVRQHWRDRFDFIISPWLNSPTVRARGDVWDTKADHWGPGVRWQPWMQSVGAYGLDLAGAQLDRPDASALALKGAKAVLREAYVFVGERWTTRDNVVIGEGEPSGTGFFDSFGCPMAPAVVLRHGEDEQARAIWNQVRAVAKAASWLAPGVSQ